MGPILGGSLAAVVYHHILDRIRDPKNKNTKVTDQKGADDMNLRTLEEQHQYTNRAFESNQSETNSLGSDNNHRY